MGVTANQPVFGFLDGGSFAEPDDTLRGYWGDIQGRRTLLDVVCHVAIRLIDPTQIKEIPRSCQQTISMVQLRFMRRLPPLAKWISHIAIFDEKFVLT